MSLRTRSGKGERVSKRSYMIQKVYVLGLREDRGVPELETSMGVYFSSFGQVIDVKVLKNGELRRQEGTVWLCNFYGRRGRTGSIESSSLLEGREGWLRRSQWIVRSRK